MGKRLKRRPPKVDLNDIGVGIDIDAARIIAQRENNSDEASTMTDAEWDGWIDDARSPFAGNRGWYAGWLARAYAKHDDLQNMPDVPTIGTTEFSLPGGWTAEEHAAVDAVYDESIDHVMVIGALTFATNPAANQARITEQTRHDVAASVARHDYPEPPPEALPGLRHLAADIRADVKWDADLDAMERATFKQHVAGALVEAKVMAHITDAVLNAKCVNTVPACAACEAPFGCAPGECMVRDRNRGIDSDHSFSDAIGIAPRDAIVDPPSESPRCPECHGEMMEVGEFFVCRHVFAYSLELRGRGDTRTVTHDLMRSDGERWTREMVAMGILKPEPAGDAIVSIGIDPIGGTSYTDYPMDEHDPRCDASTDRAFQCTCDVIKAGYCIISCVTGQPREPRSVGGVSTWDSWEAAGAALDAIADEPDHPDPDDFVVRSRADL